ncbi:MAG: hypothetical protein IKL58_00340 [Phascolarctobacterium sp.]|nr:hypothetical protein [Phascolarctobacterium sp.]
MGKRDNTFIRTKTYYCGGSQNKKAKYVEIDLFPMFDAEKKKGRSAREKVTAPKQKELNDKRAKRYCRLLAKANFDKGDYVLHPTYQDKYLPASIEEAEKELKNFLRRIKRAAKKKGCDLKYIYVTEQGAVKGRVHHHLLINSSCGLSREEIESLWSKPYRKGMSKEELALGYINVDRLQTHDGGIDRALKYIIKYDRNVKGKRYYNASQNLRKPYESTSDEKTSKSKFAQLVLFPEDCEEMKKHFEKANPGYELVEVTKEYNDETKSYIIRAKMRLIASMRMRR